MKESYRIMCEYYNVPLLDDESLRKIANRCAAETKGMEYVGYYASDVPVLVSNVRRLTDEANEARFYKKAANGLLDALRRARPTEDWLRWFDMRDVTRRLENEVCCGEGI